jgi:hypothetical protein
VWSPADEAEAAKEGWRIVIDGVASHVRLVVGGTFALNSDQDALNHVKRLAERGDPMANRAVAYLRSMKSPDVADWSTGDKSGGAVWLPENGADAAKAGWRIFEDSGAKRIGRIDGPTSFTTDAEAANHVKQCAQGGDWLALRAIAYLKSVCSPDVAQYGLDKLG